MDLSLEQRKRLIEEGEAIRREYERLEGDFPEVRKQKLKLRNRYEEIDRLLGATAAKAELQAQAREAEAAPPPVEAVVAPEQGASPERIKCPFCAEEIQPEAKKCRFCGEWLGETVPAAPASGPARPAPPDLSQRMLGVAGMSCAGAIACLIAAVLLPILGFLLILFLAWLDS